MKMQSADIEFIRFDAADVVTTSGYTWFQLTGSLVPGTYEFALGFGNKFAKWNPPFESNNAFKLYLNDSNKGSVKAYENSYYKILPGATYDGTFEIGSDLKIYGVEALDGPGASDKKLKDMSVILAWLEGVTQ